MISLPDSSPDEFGMMTWKHAAQPQSEYFLISEFNFRVPFAKTDVINLYPEGFAIDLLHYTQYR